MRRLKGPRRNTHETESNFAKFSQHLSLGIFCTHSSYKQRVTGREGSRYRNKERRGGSGHRNKEREGRQWVQKRWTGRGGSGHRNKEREERQWAQKRRTGRGGNGYTNGGEGDGKGVALGTEMEIEREAMKRETVVG